jgi:hypothetical protein
MRRSHRPVFLRLAALLLPLASLGVACQGGVTGTDQPPGTGGTGSGGTGGGPPTGSFNLSCDKPNLGVPVLRLMNRTELQHTLTDVFPQIAGQWSNTLPSLNASAYGYDNDSGAVVGPQLAAAVLETAEAVATAVTGTALASILPCGTAAADRACAETFLNKYGRRLFRRPITAAEHDRYLAFFDAARAKPADFKTSLKWMTVGLIQSPNALYRSEIGATGGDGTRQLSIYEQASELAYTYTGSTPSDALLTQADGGNLGDLVALAKTMLATAPGKEVLQHFFESWLDYTRVVSVEKSGITDFPTVRSDMVQETRAFVGDVVIAKAGGVASLLTAPTTYPSTALAQYYGFPAPPAAYASINRPAGRGIGILAQGSVLASRAKPNSSSPTQRGLLVFQRLLCETKPSPPNVVPPAPEPDPGQITTRARYEMVHAQGTCAGCHKLFDPIGFGFEHFDEGGRYRADENGLAINTASNVPDGDGVPVFQFADEEGLMSGLANQPVVYQCLAAHLATYAFGSGESCLGSSRVADLQSGALGVADYFSALAAEPHFTHRAAQ